MVKQVVAAAALSLAFCGVALAEHHYLGDSCAYLSVVVTNHTKQKCQLSEQHLTHGNFSYSSFPQYIEPGFSSRPTLIQQTVYGPDVRLTYQCGPGKRFTVRAQQNYCMLASGNIRADVLEELNLHAHPYKQMAGHQGRGHGLVEWIIEDIS